MTWPGGKDGVGVYQRLINEIPPHEVCVSAFLGDCAILRRKRPAAVNIGIDLDRANVERWAAAPPVPGLALYCCDAVEWLRFEFDFYAVRPSPPAPLPGVPGRGEQISPGGVAGNGVARAARKPAAGSRAEENGGAGHQGQKNRGQKNRSLHFSVVDFPVASGGTGPHDAAAGTSAPFVSSTFVKPALQKCFIYADPPYLMATRSSKKRLYVHEMSEAQHGRLLETLVAMGSSSQATRLSGPYIMVSHYPCRLYAEALAGWRTFTFQSPTRGGRMATEQVWCNYGVPAELHDARYLGRNKREREKIRRRVRNLTRGLARLPALERQAMLDAIAGNGR